MRERTHACLVALFTVPRSRGPLVATSDCNYTPLAVASVTPSAFYSDYTSQRHRVKRSLAPGSFLVGDVAPSRRITMEISTITLIAARQISPELAPQIINYANCHAIVSSRVWIASRSFDLKGVDNKTKKLIQIQCNFIDNLE